MVLRSSRKTNAVSANKFSRAVGYVNAIMLANISGWAQLPGFPVPALWFDDTFVN